MKIHNFKKNNVYSYGSQLSLYIKYNSLADEKFWNVEVSYMIQYLLWRIFATNIHSECLFLRFPLFKKNLQHPVSSYKSRAALLPRLMQSHREFASAASY